MPKSETSENVDFSFVEEVGISAPQVVFEGKELREGISFKDKVVDFEEKLMNLGEDGVAQEERGFDTTFLERKKKSLEKKIHRFDL